MTVTDLEERLRLQSRELRSKIRKVRLWNAAMMLFGSAFGFGIIGLSKVTMWKSASAIGLTILTTLIILGMVVMVFWVLSKTVRAASLDTKIRSMNPQSHR